MGRERRGERDGERRMEKEERELGMDEGSARRVKGRGIREGIKTVKGKVERGRRR